MRGHTHLLFALLIGLIYIKYFEFDFWSKIFFAAMLIIGALLPDIDQENAIIGKKFYFSRIMTHRGLMHAIWIPAAAFIASFTFRPLIGFVLGYSSHLLADALTVQGVRPFAPLSKKSIRGWVKTDGLGEWLILICIVSYILLIV